MIQPTNQNPDPSKSYEIILGKGVKVTTDKKSRTRVVNFPFEFPDGNPGVMIICKVKDDDWIPNTEIYSIEINFKQ